MATIQVVRYRANWFHCPGGISVVQYAEGEYYAVSEETMQHVAQGHAELIEVDQSAERAALIAEKARKAAAVAAERADEASAAADAAVAAEAIAAEPDVQQVIAEA